MTQPADRRLATEKYAAAAAAAAKVRSNQTGTQDASTISDFAQAVLGVAGGGGGVPVSLDGVPADTLVLSSVLPTPAELGAAPASLADTVARKADLDPNTGYVASSQLPPGAGGGSGTGTGLVITGQRLMVDGDTVRIDFTAGDRCIGAGFVFAKPPTITLSISSTAPIGTTMRATYSLPDATGFTLAFRRSTTAQTEVSWVATGVSA